MAVQQRVLSSRMGEVCLWIGIDTLLRIRPGPELESQSRMRFSVWEWVALEPFRIVWAWCIRLFRRIKPIQMSIFLKVELIKRKCD